MTMTTRSRHFVLITATLGAAAALVLGGGLSGVSAAEKSTPDPVAVLAAASPEALANTAASSASLAQGSAQKLATSGTPVIALKADSATPVTIAAPFSDTASPRSTDQAGVAAYDNGNHTSTVAVTHTHGSVAFNTVIWDSTAPSSYSYTLDLADGSTLHQNSSGTISILDAAGSWTGGVKPAWARDANGRPIPTRYEITGSILTQTVDLSQPGIAFPVVADPWFGSDLIDHVTWVPGDPQWGPTAQVYPTDYGRDQLAVGPEANEAAWGEALEKGDRSRLDHDNLHDQFSCHFLGRATTAGKESWNLDSNRPDVGLAATIAASCNPQGGED